MKTLLIVNFDSLQFNTSFTIENPPALPLEGECFSAKWDDFIDDKEIIVALEEYEDNKVFITSIVGKHYTKEYLALTIVLVEEDQYELL